MFPPASHWSLSAWVFLTLHSCPHLCSCNEVVEVLFQFKVSNISPSMTEILKGVFALPISLRLHPAEPRMPDKYVCMCYRYVASLDIGYMYGVGWVTNGNFISLLFVFTMFLVLVLISCVGVHPLQWFAPLWQLARDAV